MNGLTKWAAFPLSLLGGEAAAGLHSVDWVLVVKDITYANIVQL